MNQISFEDLFEEEKEKVEVAEVCKVPAPLSPLQKDILELIDSEEISALELCERLIRSVKYPMKDSQRISLKHMGKYAYY